MIFLVRLKHKIYNYHTLISLLILLLAVGIAALAYFEKGDILTKGVPLIGTLLAGFYFFQKQYLDETRLFKELFDDFNQRYDELNEFLHSILGLENKEPNNLSEAQKCKLFDYFNLCAEEYLYYKKGFIPPEVWNAWNEGMKSFFDDPKIRKLWDEEIKDEKTRRSYYGFDKEI